MAELEFQEVTRIYPGNVRAVDAFSLHVPDGSFTVLLGPSGCGKSTTLRLVAGLEPPDAGSIRIGEQIVNHVPPQRRDVAFVFQDYALYPHMSVRANMGFGLKMRGFKSSEIQRGVLETSRILGLEQLVDRYPAQLSGGERQRVALGRAIVRSPAVFLLDEPLSNLDAQLRSEMRIELKRLQRRLAGTFVFVTHDQVEAMTLADKVAVMRDGILQQAGPPEEIYMRPANVFVARFVGSPRINLIEGVLSRGNGDLAFEAPGLVTRVPDAATYPTHGKIILGIRPEHIRVDSRGDIEAAVEVVESLGSQNFFYASTPGGFEIRFGGDSDSTRAVGERVRLAMPSGAMHFFDAGTGMRIASDRA